MHFAAVFAQMIDLNFDAIWRQNRADTFGPFAKMTKGEPAWSYYEIDASHSPNVTAPETLMAVLQKIVT